jgi:hypothetical protein
MKKFILSSLIVLTLLTGCSSVYQTGQTPDDLYYAAGATPSENYTRNREEPDQYQEDISTQDDNYLRMKVANRNRWGAIDNFSYWNDMRYDYGFNSFYSPYAFNYNPFMSNHGIGLYGSYYSGFGNCFCGMGNFYSGLGYGGFYSGYGNYYGNYMGWRNPMYTVINYSKPRIFNRTYTSGSNLSSYRNNTYNNRNSTYNNSNNTTGDPNRNSNITRRITPSPSSGGNNSSYDRSVRTFSSSGTSSTSGTSSSAGGASGGFKSTGSSAQSGRGGRN